MKLLILGGTGDAKRLAQGLIKAAELAARPIDIIYSVAGLVRIPDLACEVISGGFTPLGGLKAFIRERRIDALCDATHPYAQNMSLAAVTAAAGAKIPCWRLERSEWQSQVGDDWRLCAGWSELLAQVSAYRSVFISSGQLSASVASHWQYAQLKHDERLGSPQRQLLRTTVAPTFELPPNMQWLQAIGPFELEGELALMRERGIDCLISKNSGGKATAAKLKAARRLGIPVLMLERPPLPSCDVSFYSTEQAQAYIEPLLIRPNLSVED